MSLLENISLEDLPTRRVEVRVVNSMQERVKAVLSLYSDTVEAISEDVLAVDMPAYYWPHETNQAQLIVEIRQPDGECAPSFVVSIAPTGCWNLRAGNIFTHEATGRPPAPENGSRPT